MPREEQDSSGAEWSFDSFQCGCLLVSSKFNSFCFGSENFICAPPACALATLRGSYLVTIY